MTPIPAALCAELFRQLDMRAIAAMAENGVIGSGNAIPWNIPEEMAFFRKMTANASVLMGRKTFESIGHPLPNRKNIVITNSGSWACDGVTVIGSFDQLFHVEIRNTLWICGGAAVYEELLPACRELYLSVIFGKWHGDVKFPDFNGIFVKDETIFTCPSFRIEHYVHKLLQEK
ncbi:MAG: dihydrofolate reductase [Puniceicoccales bacterium]|jgi:dihydrofolate reductase|nr:dihydrofolate reductase [Puniceicoccales bacterium]